MQKKKGISLIVLVITIIVMIILAGAVIISLNNSGIIDRANTAKKEYNDKEYETQIKVAILEFEVDKLKDSNLTIEQSIKANLEKVYNDTVTVEKGKKCITVTFENSNLKYRHLANGNVIRLMDPTPVYGKFDNGTLYLRKTENSGYKLLNPNNGEVNTNVVIEDIKLITKIVIEEPIAPQTTRWMFVNLNNLKTIENIENLHTENSNSMQYMFSQCRSLTSLDVSKFDTSSVTNMGSMFSGCSSLISLDVSKFDTSSVTNMGYMFFYCSSLTSLDVSKFDTSSVTNMEHMFSDCSNLVEINANNLDVSNVKNMSDLFSYCSKLETAKMNSWKAKEITDTNNMFRQCGKIKEINLSGFDTSKVTNMSRLFYLCNSLKK